MLQPGYLFWKISRSLEHLLLKPTVEYEICIPTGSQIGFCERGWFNIKIQSYQYRNSHCGDKTISGLSYLHSGISCAGKTAPLYWICPHVAKHFLFDKYRHSECSNVHLNVNFLIMLQPWYLFWKISCSLEYLSLYPPHNEVVGGVYWFHSVRPSVCPSVRPSRMPCPLCIIYSYGWILFILGTNDHYHERVCRAPWPLTLTYIFKVIWPWLRKSCPLCSVYSSGWILSIFGTNDHYH